MKRVGFIINSRVPEFASFAKGMRPHNLLVGWDDAASPMSFMRFHWVADALRGSDVRYELYRPWRTYDAVVFLKSMGPHCLALAQRLRSDGTRIVFEANVDYYTRFDGEAQLAAMSPSREQRENAMAITEFADVVIASSRHLAEVCSRINPRARWVPDNVNFSMVPEMTSVSPMRDGRVRIWWSGMADKLFEFLAAEEAFLTVARHVHLELVTDDVNAGRKRWPVEVRDRFSRLLDRVPHTFHRFRDIPGLLKLYAAGGVIVSPRYLDVPYNLSHTEWKITLGMACGLPAIASPVPSYADVAERAGAGAVTICEGVSDWTAALESAVRGENKGASEAAQKVVREHYATELVAKRHRKCVMEALEVSRS